MIRSRDTALALSALDELGELLLSADPAWVWSRDGSRVLWANPAGGAYLGCARFSDVVNRHWADGHQLRRSISQLARSLPDGGALARLRLRGNLLALPVACRCQPVRAGDVRGVLVATLQATDGTLSLSDLAAFFGTAATGAVVLDDEGRVLAESAPGVGEARTYAMPYASFAEGRRTLRLGFVDLDVRVGERAATRRRAAVIEQDVGAPVAESPAPLGPDPESPPTSTHPRAEPAPPAVDRRPESAETKPPAPESDEPAKRSVSAGRVPHDLSRKPVRFLWQTDANDRYLFVSPGLSEVVGRNAEIVGESWTDAAARLRLDPAGRIGQALKRRDTWSGLTAWWPVEGSQVRVPAELTALPVFAADQSFQGYRGFGVLRPAEALMPATFETRFGPGDAPPADQTPPYEEVVDPATANVVPIRADLERMTEQERLSPQERMAFEEIAAALQNRVVDEAPGDAEVAWVDGEPRSQETTPEPDEATPPVVDLFPGDTAEDTPVEDAAEASRPRSITPQMPARSHVTQPSVETLASAPQPTDMSDAERRLREMTAILDTATDGVLILDAAGVIESVNASAEALFGLDAREMRDRGFVDLLTEESRGEVLDYLSGLKDSGVASLLNEGREVAARAGSGSIPLFMTMGRVSSDEGGRFCAVLRDITHWKRIEAELREAKRSAEEASRQKSDFLARVSHEIRTPLNAIIGFAEVMIEERFGPIDHERYREYLRDIRTSGEHVVSLVNDLLDISKIEAGRLDLDFAAVPLNELVRDCIGLMQPQAGRAHVVLRSSLSRDVPAIVADERTMRQIVLNLLSNSVKYTDPGGQVIASTSLSDNGEAVLRVRDTGEGMSEDDLQRALEPFRQLTTASLSEGTGLGLPLTKALVEANRASLSIKSARGEGTVVTVTIPPTRVLSE